MRMKNKLIILFFIFISCTSKEKTNTILIDVNKAIEINVDEKFDDKIYFDTCQNAIIGNVNRVYTLDDSYIIYSKNKLLKFNKNDGKLIFKFSEVGKAKNEYIDLWDCWKSQDTLFIYDMNGRKILKYDINNNLIGTVPLNRDINKPFQTISPIGNDYYIGKRVYSGEKTEELYLYDNNFIGIKEIKGLDLTSGIYLGYPFASYKNEILYWRHLDGVIYNIHLNGEVTEKYTINFGEMNIPSDIEFADEYEKLEFANKDAKQYATFVSNVFENDTYLFFTYLYNRGKYFALYDKKKNSERSFKVSSKAKMTINNIFMNDDILIFAEDDNGESVLLTLKINNI